MTTVNFFTPDYIEAPQTFGDKVRNFAEGYFDLSGSCLTTALKVISYATLIIPAIMLAIRTYLRYSSGQVRALQMPIAAHSPIPDELLALLNEAPQFRGYLIGDGINLTSAAIRPANLFYKALFGDGATTMPGSGQLFAFNREPEAIQLEIADLDDEITVQAEGNCRIHGRAGEVPLTDLYGHGQFRISRNEIRSILDSQRIYTAPLLPRDFYLRLKRAMQEDGMVVLPGPVRVSGLNTPHCAALIAEVANDPELRNLLDLTVYQLGSLVVKTEDYYLLTNPDGTIRERQPGDNDAIRLINACGIRPPQGAGNGPITNRMIMRQTFSTALIAAESGYVVFPAVGMGVWGGDPDLYWRAFLDAVANAPADIEQIFVNPRHQRTPAGHYAGRDGSEFQEIFADYRRRFAADPVASANLAKVINLYDRQTDVLHFSRQLSQAFPDKIVSLFNASDPDVTLGNHVGEYVNNLNHPNTTEENYTALGTNGLCFERITGIHGHPNRIIQT